MFTKKHFEAIAKILRPYSTDSSEDMRKAAKGIALSLAAEFSDSNPRFDTSRFLKASGVQS